MTMRHGLLALTAAFTWWLLCEWSPGRVRLELAISDHWVVVELALPTADEA